MYENFKKLRIIIRAKDERKIRQEQSQNANPVSCFTT